MKRLFLLGIVAISLFPACRRNKHYGQTRPADGHVENREEDFTAKLVDRSLRGKGVACVVAAPVALGTGSGLAALTVSKAVCMEMIILGPLAAGIFLGAAVGSVALLWTGCSCLSTYAQERKKLKRVQGKRDTKNRRPKESAELSQNIVEGAARSMPVSETALAS